MSDLVRTQIDGFLMHRLIFNVFFRGIISGLQVVGKNLAAGLIMLFIGIFYGAIAIMMFAALVKVSAKSQWAPGLMFLVL